jgi:hypothetical protein
VIREFKLLILAFRPLKEEIRTINEKDNIEREKIMYPRFSIEYLTSETVSIKNIIDELINAEVTITCFRKFLLMYL